MATTPVMTAVALAIAIGALAFYDGRDKAGEIGSKSAAVASAIGVLLVTWVIWSVAADRTPLASGELQGDTVLNVPAQDTPVSLLVHADLPRVKTGQSSGGDYRLDVRVGGKVLEQLDGEVSETWRRGRAGRRGHTENLVARLEHRYDLPAEGEGQAMTISVAKESGDLHAPLKVIAETAPPTPLLVGVLGLLATLAVTVADVLGGRQTRSGIWVGLQGALAYTLLDGVYPHSGAMSVIGAGMFAVLLGLPLSLLIRWTVFAMPLGASKEPPQDVAQGAV